MRLWIPSGRVIGVNHLSVNHVSARFPLHFCTLFVVAFLLSVGIRPVVAQQPVPRVQLNEFMAAPQPGAPEFVELFIAGTSPISSDRLALRDSSSPWRRLPANARLFMPGDFLVVTPDTSLFRSWFQDAFPDLSTPERVIELRPWPALNNSGDSLAVALDGHQLERLGYASDHVERGRSLERLQAFLPAYAAPNWSLPLTGPGSPGSPNTVFRVDTTAPFVRGVEQLDSTTLRLYFSEPLWKADIRALQLRLAGDDPSGPVTRAELAASPDAFTAAQVHLPEPLAGRTLSVSGLRDPSGNSALPSSHPVHGAPGPGDLLMTEIMLRGNPDFVEVLVDTDRHLSLRHIRLTRTTGEPLPIAEVGHDADHLVSPGDILVMDTSLPSGGETLLLGTGGEAQAARMAAVIDSVVIDPGMEDGRFRRHADRSLVRVGPGPKDWASSLSPPATPGVDSAVDLRQRVPLEPAPHALTLTEVLYDPLDDPSDGLPDQVEFLEWTNASSEPVSLFGSFMTWEINEQGTSDTLRLGYQPLVLPPGSAVVAFQIPSHVSGSDDPARSLQHIWPLTTDSVRTLPLRKSLALLNSGRSITLHARDHSILAHGRYTPDDHHPAVAAGKGLALVRLQTSFGFAPWTTSTEPTGASPGRVDGDSGGNGDLEPDKAFNTDLKRPRASLSPRSFYPEHPDLGGRTLIHVYVPATGGPRVLQAQVRDLHAHVVRVLARGLLIQGPHTLAWDGRQDDGSLLPSGPYIVEVRLTSPGHAVFRMPVALLRR